LSSERDRGLAERVVCLGLLLSPHFQTANDKKKGFSNLGTPEENLQQILSLHLVGLQEGRRKKERKKTWTRVFMAEIQI
jgi:hypothetical protein